MRKLIRTGVAILPLCVAACAEAENGRGSGGQGSSGIGDPGSADGGGTGSGTDGGTGGSDSSGGGVGTSGTGSDSGTGSSGTGSSGTGSSGTGSSGTGSSGTGSSGTGSSGTGSSGTGSTTSDGTTASIVPCQEEQATVEPIPPRILFVLDKSGSMSCTDFHWDDDNDCLGMCSGGCTPCVTRWSTLYNVVSNVVNAWESQIYFGAHLYPNDQAFCTDNNCGLSGGTCFNGCLVNTDPEVPLALDNAATITSTIPPEHTLVQGSTPMESGLNNALTWMRANVDASLPRALLLVADGDVSTGCLGESFSDANNLVANAWTTDGIATYVVGITDTAATQLNQLALSGGKPKPGGPPHYHKTDNQADLDAAMQEIIDDALSCVIPIDPEPDDPALFEVWIGGVIVPEVTDCAIENGWVWTVQHSEIEFCGTACDDLQTVGTVDIKYYCIPG